jgi:hypothetical protein
LLTIHPKRNTYNGLSTKTLIWEVYSQKDPARFLYGVILNEVYEHESDLDRGRFQNYTQSAQPNQINLDLDLGGLSGIEPIHMQAEKWIDWIAQHSTALWSLSINMKDVSEGVAAFSFADSTTAVMFKLVFG